MKLKSKKWGDNFLRDCLNQLMQSTGNNFPFHPKFQNLLINPIKTKKKFSKTKFNKPNAYISENSYGLI